MKAASHLLILILSFLSTQAYGVESPSKIADLTLNKSEVVQFKKNKIPLKLLKISDHRDPIRNAIRKSVIKLQIFNKELDLECGNYQLPITIQNIRIDCTVTKGYLAESMHNGWELKKDARIRIFENSNYFSKNEFVYPVRQKWFASQTQLGNEPVFVDSGDHPGEKEFYYHYGVDIGGAEALTQVVSSTDGIITAVGGKNDGEGPKNWCQSPSEVCIKDNRGWFHKYSHLNQVDSKILLGKKISAGQLIGLIGKEGNSGGWAHLHYDIRRLMPSGLYGSESAYPYLLEAYVREYKAPLLAIGRPHHFGPPGSIFQFDAQKSFSKTSIKEAIWQYGDIKKVGPTASFQFDEVGSRQVILKITNSKGHIDYDFIDIHTLDPNKKYAPTLHSAFHPTHEIKANQKIIFLSRAFRGDEGKMEWDFADGDTQRLAYKVQKDSHADAYLKVEHSYKKSGLYLVKVIYTDKSGLSAENYLKVLVQ